MTTTLRLTNKTSIPAFKPEVGLGSTSRLTAKRQYPAWRRWMTGLITGTCALTVIGIALASVLA